MAGRHLLLHFEKSKALSSLRLLLLSPPPFSLPFFPMLHLLFKKFIPLESFQPWLDTSP